MTMTNGAFSTLKSQITTATGKSGQFTTASGKSGPIPTAPNATAPKFVPAPSRHDNPAELARIIKERVKAHGVEAVREMTSVFAD